MLSSRWNPMLKSTLVLALLLPPGMSWAQTQSVVKRKLKPPPLQVSPADFQKAAAVLGPGAPMISGSITAADLDKDIVLPPTGVTALQESHQFLANQKPPTIDADGWVTYIYGQSLPVVVLSPLHVTAIKLQRGEIVNPDSRELTGDSAIHVSPHTVGTGADLQTVVFLKAKNAGTSSDVVLATNRRVYTLPVYVKPYDYTPRIAFTYPEDEEQARWNHYEAQERETLQAEQQKRAEQRLALLDTSGPIRNTNYEIKVKGRQARAFRPVSVGDDGVRTLIDLPKNAAVHDLPIPKVYNGKGQDSPNYRYEGSRLIIDSLFDHCELLSGVGRKQQKVVIINRNPLPEGEQHARR